MARVLIIPLTNGRSFVRGHERVIELAKNRLEEHPNHPDTIMVLTPLAPADIRRRAAADGLKVDVRTLDAVQPDLDFQIRAVLQFLRESTILRSRFDKVIFICERRQLREASKIADVIMGRHYASSWWIETSAPAPYPTCLLLQKMFNAISYHFNWRRLRERRTA